MRLGAVGVAFYLLLSVAAAAAPAIPSGSSGQEWPHASPSSVGLSESAIQSLDADIVRGKYRFVDHLLVIRCGAEAFERSYLHDYADVYRKEARTKGPLNAH